MDEITAWFRGRLPDDWFVDEPEILVDRDEILVIGRVPEVEDAGETGEAAAEARIARWRDETRPQRVRIAVEAQRRFDRKVSWGARCGEVGRLFTHLALPVMTRLRLKERAVLDTLVESGVARSRSDALAWCVRLVARNEEEWLDGLRDALREVERAREAGPKAS